MKVGDLVLTSWQEDPTMLWIILEIEDDGRHWIYSLMSGYKTYTNAFFLKAVNETRRFS